MERRKISLVTIRVVCYSFFIFVPNILTGDSKNNALQLWCPNRGETGNQGTFRGLLLPTDTKDLAEGKTFCVALLRTTLGGQEALRYVHCEDEDRRFQKVQVAGLGSL